ncbi:hypothetical protein BGE01nite_56930 [Brevifollis gellanilyticus]|uniref:Uncharacterized protein n=2 Tax=Brevifollis gellanilyticus TaxID=748831 RepID=A0A512MI40_9BACT|nr:hypothetical protein BGE01nite_56930 [Brevifollis gellanilyticus]
MARIGETRAQCEARYGPPVEVRDNGETTVHSRAGYGVRCTYLEGKCEAIRFRKMPASPGQDDLPFTEAEQKALMEANSGGKTWTKKREDAEFRMQQWECDGLQAMHNGTLHFFTVYTSAYAVRLGTKDAVDKAANDKSDDKGSFKDF